MADSALCSARSTRRSQASWRFPNAAKACLWFSSSVLLSALGFYMWPHAFGAVYHRARRRRVTQERDRHAALPAHPAVRVLRRIRRRPEGSRSQGRRSGSGPVPNFDPDLRSVVRRRHRRRRHLDRAGSRLADPDGRRHAMRQRSAGAADRRHHSRSHRAHRTRFRSDLGARGGVVRDRRQPDHRGAPADGLRLRHPALSLR